MADLTSVEPMLKEVWPDSFETAFSQEIVGIARIERTSEGISQDISGRYVVVPMKVRRNQGIGSRAERGILPLPGKQGFVGSRVTMRYQYGIGDITVQGLKLADKEPRSFVNLLDQEMTGLRDDVMKDYARQFYGDGTGTLGTVQSVTGNDIVLDSTQYFEEEMLIDSVDATGPTVNATAMEIDSIDVDTKTVTVDDATGVVAGDVLVRTGDFNQEINGLDVLVDDTDAVQNLDPADEPKWAAQIHDNGGTARAYDELHLIKAMDRGRRLTGKFASVIFTDFGGRRAVFNDLVQGREYTNTIEYAQGFSAMPFNYGAQTVPIVEDPDYPTDFDSDSTSFTGVVEDDVKVYRDPEGWHFAEETGSMFIAKQDRSDAWEFRIRQISQLGISQRNCHWRVEDITNVPE